MSISFILGNVLGRALVSYGLVWLICWLTCRFNWRVAFRRSGRWYSVMAVVVLTLLGMGAALGRGGAP